MRKCHRAFYCSIQCQRKDWRSHKKECSSDSRTQPITSTDDQATTKPIFCQPFSLEKFIPYLEKIKENTKRSAIGWVNVRLAGLMDADSSLATCYVFYTSEGHVREHMIFMEAVPHVDILQRFMDQFQAHAISMFAEIRYINPHSMAVVKEGVLLQVSAKGYDTKFFFDQTHGGRSESGVLLCVSDPEECHISLFDAARWWRNEKHRYC